MINIQAVTPEYALLMKKLGTSLKVLAGTSVQNNETTPYT